MLFRSNQLINEKFAKKSDIEQVNQTIVDMEPEYLVTYYNDSLTDVIESEFSTYQSLSKKDGTKFYPITQTGAVIHNSECLQDVIGDSDISTVGDGSITGAIQDNSEKITKSNNVISELNTKIKDYSSIIGTSSQYVENVPAMSWTEVGKANITVPKDGHYEIYAKVSANGVTAANTGVCTAKLKCDGGESGITPRSSFPIKVGLMTNTTCITVKYLKAGTHVLSLDVYPDSQIGAGYCSFLVKAF